MRPLTLALVLVPFAAASSARERPTNPYGQWTPEQVCGSTIRGDLVIVGKVVEAGAPAGAGWKRTGHFFRLETKTLPVDVQQQVTVEVSQVLRGRKPGGKLRVSLKELNLPIRLMRQVARKRPGEKGRGGVYHVGLPAKRFALVKGKSYLFFLSAAKKVKVEGPPAGERLVAESAPGAVPVEEPDEKLVAPVKIVCRLLKEWDHPPKLAPAVKAKVRALVAELGSDDFKARDKAQAALVAMGPRIRVPLEAAAKDADAERSERAGNGLRAVRPSPENLWPAAQKLLKEKKTPPVPKKPAPKKPARKD